MSATVEERLAAAEREIERLTTRVARLEGSSARPPVPQQRPALTWTEPPTWPKLPVRPARPSRQPRSLDLEELLGGRILAVVGGAAVLIGLAFFVALAIDRGWIGETAASCSCWPL
jgi:uncharacterized membrane protein